MDCKTNCAGTEILHWWFGMQAPKVRAKFSHGENFNPAPLSPSFFVFFLQSRRCFNFPSQFLSSSLLSSSSPERLVCNIKDLKIQLSISYFKLWHWHDDIIAVSKTDLSIHPFKFSHLFLPVNVLHNSLYPDIPSIRLSSICPNNNSTAFSLSFSSTIFSPYSPPHLWNSTSRMCDQLFFRFFFKDSFYPSENQRHLLSFIYSWTL